MEITQPYAKDIFDAYSLFHTGILALHELEMQGMRVDLDYLDRENARITNKIAKLEEVIYESDFYAKWVKYAKGKTVNIYSPKQMGDYLYNALGIKVKKQTKSGDGSTDDETLSQLGIPELKTFLEIKKLKKLRDTYLNGFAQEQVDGFIHPFFTLHLVKTYRGASSAPNFQNIPKREEKAMKVCRRALFPRVGNQLLEVDFGQLEVRIAACVTKDTQLETIDGSQRVTKIIQRVNKGEDVYIYGYSFDKSRIAVSKVTAGGLTKQKAEVWKITLDNGKSIKATPSHKFLLRNGEYKELQHLQVGESLMPFYKKKRVSQWKTVYSTIYLNNGETVLAHNLIAEDVFGKKITGSNLVVHHKNHNGCDNSLKNIEVMTRAQHMKIHSVEGWKNNPRIGEKNWATTRIGRRTLSKQAKKQWDSLSDFERSEMKRRIKEGINAVQGNIGKNNPMYGKKHSEETKNKISKTKTGVKTGKTWNKGLNKSNSKRVCEIAKKLEGRTAWNKGKTGLYTATEETRRKLRIANIGKDFSESTRKKLSENKKQYWTDRKMSKKVRCAICGCSFVSVTNTHLENKHQLSLEEYKKTYNHKVASIEFYGYEDVYNINVDGFHNYATSAGVIIKNCYHLDPNMIKYIETGHDMHKDVCMQIFKIKEYDGDLHGKLRSATKNGFVFPEFYGDYYKSCAEYIATNWCSLPKTKWKSGQGIKLGEEHLSDHMLRVGLTSYDKFEAHLQAIETDFWKTRFKVYDKWKERWWQEYQKKGYFTSKTGFLYGGVMSRNDAINYPVQGAAFHVLLWCLQTAIKTFKKLGMDTKIVGQIHDALVLDVAPDELQEVVKIMKQIMEVDVRKHWPWIIVPLEIDAELCPVDGSWAEKQKFKIH